MPRRLQPEAKRPRRTAIGIHRNECRQNGDRANRRSVRSQSAHRSGSSIIAYARSGDKGIDANIGVIARRPRRLRSAVSRSDGRTCGGIFRHRRRRPRDALRSCRTLDAINLVIRGILANPLAASTCKAKPRPGAFCEMPLGRTDCKTGSSDGCPVLIRWSKLDRCDGVVLTLNRPERRNALTIELMDAIVRDAGIVGRRAAAARRHPPRRRGRRSAPGSTCTRPLKPNWPSRVAICGRPDVSDALRQPAGHDCGRTRRGLRGRGRLDGLLRLRRRGRRPAGSAFPRSAAGLLPALAAAALCADACATAISANCCCWAKPIDARRACKMGLVDRVVPAEQLLAEARAIAAAILKGGPDAVRQTKRLLRELVAGRSPAALCPGAGVPQAGPAERRSPRRAWPPFTSTAGRIGPTGIE